MSHLKVQLVILIQYTLSQNLQIATQGPLALYSVCTEKQSGGRTQSWLCKWGTSIVARTKPYTNPANQHVASGTWKEGGYYLIGC